mmetsp:Transcript_26715/g.26958  ORF Transcript_26715/g.26958 Transcript_26715/m.26958 type:complete len:183 (-) Transcript_26715:436-984(-)
MIALNQHKLQKHPDINTHSTTHSTTQSNTHTTTNSHIHSQISSTTDSFLIQDNKCYCDICDKTFVSQIALNQHNAQKHVNKETSLPSLTDMNNHQEHVHNTNMTVQPADITKYECEACQKSFSTLIGLNQHNEQKHREKTSDTASKIQTHKCQICNETFKSKSALNQHCDKTKHLKKVIKMS